MEKLAFISYSSEDRDIAERVASGPGWVLRGLRLAGCGQITVMEITMTCVQP